MRTIFCLLLLMGSSLEAGQLAPCVEEDICSAITFNQLSLAAITHDMKEMMREFSHRCKTDEGVQNEDLNICQNRNQDLEKELISLEMKHLEAMSKDEGRDDAKDKLRRELEDLGRARDILQEENQRLQEVILRQEERIKNLTVLTYMPVDCADIRIQGQTESGVYTIYPYQTDESIEVLCDLESSEGGWTVFFTRQPQDEALDFNETWVNFSRGFGNVNTEYWLGNELLHTLTTSHGSTSLRMDAEIFSGERRWAEWNIFNVGDEDSNYQLTLGGYEDKTSTLGDSLSRNSGSFFTTFDRDNDEQDDLNCAVGTKHSSWGEGGWWYKACGSTRPTAPLRNTSTWDSACWENWDTEGRNLVSFKSLSMKLRRLNYEELAVNGDLP